MCRGTGPGGQKRNKTESAVQVKHLPTGLVVRCDLTRSQPQNRLLAIEQLREKLQADLHSGEISKYNQTRKTQIGSGMRGDKRRTIRVQNDEVVDHVSGKRWKYKDYSRGNW